MDTEMRHPSALLGAAAVVLILAAIHFSSTLIVLIAISFIVTVLAAPLQSRLLVRGWARWAAFVTTLVPVLLLLAAVFWALDLSLTAFVSDLPSYRPGGEQLVQDVLNLGQAIGVNLSHLVRAGAFVQSAFSEADVLTRTFLKSIAGWAVVLTLTGFMLYEALDYPEKAKRLVGEGDAYDRLTRFTSALSRYTWILTLGAAFTAAGDLAILLALGIPSAFLWAALAFLLSYIPSVGSFIIVVPPTIATLLRFGFTKALLVLALLLAVDNIVGVVVVPKLVGSRLSVSPFWGMLSLLFWGWLLGPVGAILALPMTLTAKFLLESSPATERLARLMEPIRGAPDR